MVVVDVNLNLQKKAVIGVNALIIFVCICMGIIGYRSASESFDIPLLMKVRSNVNSIVEIMDYKYPGDWQIEGNELYKGKTKINDNNELVDALGKVCEGHVTIFQNDTRVATTVKKEDGQRSTGTKVSEQVGNEVLKGGKNYIGKAMVVGKPYKSAYEPIKDSSGKVIGMVFVGLSEESLGELQRELIFKIVAAVLVIIVVLGSSSWLIIGREMKKLADASEAVGQVADGNLRINDLPVMTQDEIGSLSNSVNEMKHKLRKLLTSVASSSERVAASSEELTASATQTSESIEQVAANIVDMTANSAKQSETIKELQNTVTDMSDKMNDLLESAQAMDEVAKASLEAAFDGKQKVNFAIEQIRNIAEQVNKSAEVVGNLGNRSKEIGTIVDTISAISDQTNLLALNAAIEAARAGEHGRGFAVVADEVRQLAEQSSDAAKNISELINTIQQDTTSAVESIELGNKSVRDGSDSVIATGDAFKAIEEQVAKLNQNIKNSISHIDSVNSTSQEILQSIEEVHQLSQKSTEEAENVSAATQQQSATMHEMSDFSNQLAELAQQLQNEVQKFNI